MKFWYTKFLMRFISMVALVGFIGVLYYAYQTDLDYEPIGETAPFKEEVVNLKDTLYFEQGEEVINLAEPHRTDKEMSNWITTVASEALYIPNRQYQNSINEVSNYFTDKGKNEYLSYLEQSQVKTYIDNSNYSLNVLVDGSPLVLNAQNVSGTYRWLYQVPVTISFVPSTATSVIAAQKDAVTQKLMLILQIGRKNIDGDPEAIQIESWKMRKRS
ncbi:MAG: DotI/IcmL family type IV secretion protein [Pseudomonadota bacterium]